MGLELKFTDLNRSSMSLCPLQRSWDQFENNLPQIWCTDTPTYDFFFFFFFTSSLWPSLLYACMLCIYEFFLWSIPDGQCWKFYYIWHPYADLSVKTPKMVLLNTLSPDKRIWLLVGWNSKQVMRLLWNLIIAQSTWSGITNAGLICNTRIDSLKLQRWYYF